MPPTTIMEPSLLENIRQSNYLVIYDINQRSLYKPALLMDFLNGVAPEIVIKINGQDYVSIYKVADLPKDIF